MEEKNELNDIILNKSGGSSGSKKLLLAIATLTLILIIVLVIMNSLKSESGENAPQAVVPPAPSAPTEVINDPLFEPVEVIQEGNTTTASSEDLSQIAQKIKQESFDNAPVQETTAAPVAQQRVSAVQPKAIASVPTIASKPVQTKLVITPQPVAAPKAASPVVHTPTIKTAKSAVVKKTPAAPIAKLSVKAVEKAAVKAVETAAPKAADIGGIWYIQVGSFTKIPNQGLYDRLNASGLKYTNITSGPVTKVMVGPFQGQNAARDVLGTVRRNIEAGAFAVKG